MAGRVKASHRKSSGWLGSLRELPRRIFGLIPDHGIGDAAEFMAMMERVVKLEQPVLKVSRQLKQEVDGVFPRNVVEPPVDPWLLSEQLVLNTWHARCVNLVAVVAAGQRWEIRPRVKGAAESTLDGKQKERLLGLFRKPNPAMSLRELLQCVIADIRGIGRGYIEVIRDQRGQVAELWHVPAVMIKHAPGGGYWQVSRTKGILRKRFFKEFGNLDLVSAATGRPIAPQSSYSREGEDLSASEIIHLPEFHPRSQTYGIPWFLASVVSMQTDRAAGEWNSQFFQHNTIPSKILAFHNVELDDDTEESIEDYFTSVQKGRNHKPMVLALTTDDPGLPTKLDVIDLQKRSQDAGFLKGRAANRDEIVAAHGVPPRMVGVATPGRLGGKGDGEMQRRDFKSFLIEPLQTRIEDVINRLIIDGRIERGGKIVQAGFGIIDWVLHLGDFDLSDHEFSLSKSKELRAKVTVGMMTTNEARAELGMSKIDEPWADRHYIQTSSGPLFLDTVGEGVPQQTAPAGPDPELAGGEVAQALSKTMFEVQQLSSKLGELFEDLQGAVDEVQQIKAQLEDQEVPYAEVA